MKMQLTILHKALSSVLLLSLTLLTSCSSNYANNRILDMRDVFSFSCGYGLGAQARVSYLATGLLYKKDFMGMENGIPAWYGNGSQVTDIDAALGRVHIFNPPYDVYVRNHGVLLASGAGPFYLPQKDWLNPKWATQVDVTLALGLSVKVGFNPGELLDLLVGFFGYDLYNDDYQEEDFKKAPKVEEEAKE